MVVRGFVCLFVCFSGGKVSVEGILANWLISDYFSLCIFLSIFRGQSGAKFPTGGISPPLHAPCPYTTVVSLSLAYKTCVVRKPGNFKPSLADALFVTWPYKTASPFNSVKTHSSCFLETDGLPTKINFQNVHVHCLTSSCNLITQACFHLLSPMSFVSPVWIVHPCYECEETSLMCVSSYWSYAVATIPLKGLSGGGKQFVFYWRKLKLMLLAYTVLWIKKKTKTKANKQKTRHWEFLDFHPLNYVY